jgi:hypothetical protein
MLFLYAWKYGVLRWVGGWDIQTEILWQLLWEKNIWTKNFNMWDYNKAEQCGAFRSVREIAKRLSASSCVSVRLSARPPVAWNNSAPTERMFIKMIFIYRKSVEKIQLKLTRTCTLHEDLRTFITISCSTLNLPTTTIVAQPFNVIKWQLKFNPGA